MLWMDKAGGLPGMWEEDNTGFSLAHPRYPSKPLGCSQAGFGGKGEALYLTIPAHSSVGWERETFVSCIP